MFIKTIANKHNKLKQVIVNRCSVNSLAMPSVAICFFCNLSLCDKKTGQDIRKENDWQLNCFYPFKSKFISGVVRLLFCMKVFSNLWFLNIDIDMVNNNESN